jgi:ATPase family associated with various cellular activities (AAA)
VNAFHVLPNKKVPLNILNNVSGVIKPKRYCNTPTLEASGLDGFFNILIFIAMLLTLYILKFKISRMTLLLGPPGSGKTSLLLALAGKLDSELKVLNQPFNSFNNCFYNQLPSQKKNILLSLQNRLLERLHTTDMAWMSLCHREQQHI